MKTINENVMHAVGFAENSKSMFISTLAAVPADKGTFSPSPTAKNAIQIGAHLAVSNQNFIALIGGAEMPEMTFMEMLAHMAQEEDKFTSLEQVIAAVESSHNGLMDAMKGMSDEQLAGNLQMPFGEMPAAEMIFIPGMHYCMHQGQIDYLQTCWGDKEPHFNPE